MWMDQDELKKDYAYRKILELIGSGKVAEGRFPSEPEFCREIGVSRVTLRSALKRLEREGLITRSHYYGTRVATAAPSDKILIVTAPIPAKEYNTCAAVLQAIENMSRDNGCLFDLCDLYFLEDPVKISNKYKGIIFFGAAIRGDEPFIDILRKCTIPTVYFREDFNNVITDFFPSVGVDTSQAWDAGFDYLAELGFRKIAMIVSNDGRNAQRLGFTSPDYAEKLRKKGFKEAAELIRSVDEETCDRVVKELIARNNIEAIFCYSDYYAMRVYKILRDLGKKIPQDVAVLGFGKGSDLVTPSLSAVDLSPALCGMALVRLLLDEELLKTAPSAQIVLPFGIYKGGSTRNINLSNLQLFISKKQSQKDMI